MRILRRLPGTWLAGLTAVLGISAVSALFIAAGGASACGAAGCPATGDDTHMALWLVLCAVSLLLLVAGVVAAVVLHRKKRGDR